MDSNPPISQNERQALNSLGHPIWSVDGVRIGFMKKFVLKFPVGCVIFIGLTFAVSEPSELTGAKNLMVNYGLEHSYNRFSGKKVKEELSAFLPSLPGYIDSPGLQDNR